MYYETVTSVTSVTSVFEVFPGNEFFFFFNFLQKKKKWNIGIGENTCHHVTHVTHLKIVINTRYKKEVLTPIRKPRSIITLALSKHYLFQVRNIYYFRKSCTLVKE